MKYLPNIAGALLGVIFAGLAIMKLLHVGPSPAPPPPGSLAAMFLGAFFQSGYFTFLKIMETLGGILVAIPKTRNFGLLILGPVVVNILCFSTFITKGVGLLSPIVITVTVLSLYLLWCGRKKFAGLLN